MFVLIVDDHPVIRQGLMQIVAQEFKGAHFGEAGSAAEALRQLAERKWDLVLLDVSLPDRSGLEVLTDARQRWAELKVLVLSMHPECQYAARFLRSGASGYIAKDAPRAELVRALRKVAAGAKYINPKFAEQYITGAPGAEGTASHEQLSNREYQVFYSVGSGKRLSEIAAELHLSVKTVSTYKHRVFEKMHFKSDAELAQYMCKHNLI